MKIIKLSRGLIFGVLFSHFLCGNALADEAKPRFNILQNCEEEIDLYCQDEIKASKVALCLVSHDSDLSNECKQDLEKFVQARRQAASRGGGALSSFGGLNAMGPPIPLISYDGRYSPSSPPSFTENKGNISVPVYESRNDTVALSLAGGDFHLGDPLKLSSGIVVPKDFYRLEFGTQYFHQLSDQKNWGLRTSVGVASDKPFEKLSDLTYSFSLNYGFATSEKSRWLLFLLFSNNSLLYNYVPIPGFAYTYKTETFSGMFGFPILSMQWTPVFPWAFSLSVFFPTMQSEVSYGSIDRFQFFSGYYWTRQKYIPSQTVNNDDLTIEEMKAAIGLRTPIWASSIIGELQLGRAFDRSLFIGSGFTNKDGGSVSVSPNWYTSLGIRARF